MKMAIKVGLVLGMVLLVCSWTAGVLAQERRPHEQPKQVREVLGLTETQITAVQAEQEAAGARMHDLREQIQMLDEQVYQTAEQTGDPTTIGKLVLQKIALQKQIEGEEASLREKINSILTPEQQDKLKQLREGDHLSRGWDALLGGGEPRQRHEGVPGGGSIRPHRERPPEK